MNLFDELTVSDQSEFGLSVLGALDSAGIPYEAEPSSYGVYVKSINGKAAGGNDGWMFMVNGISPSSSADSTTIKAGDQVIWFYGTSVNNYQRPSWAELNGTEIGAESEYFEGTGISSDPYLIDVYKRQVFASDQVQNFYVMSQAGKYAIAKCKVIIGSTTPYYDCVFDMEKKERCV